MKLCAFDFDSTLMDGETIDILAEAAGQAQLVRQITEAAMQGELDFFEALRARVRLLSGLSYQQVLEICRSVPLMPGALECVRVLKSRGYRVVIFSGGFREATAPAAHKLAADADFANFLHHKAGVLTGEVGGEMMQSTSKGEMLGRLQQLLGVSQVDTVAVGDGANDLSMFEHAATNIAFCAKPILKAAADYCVDTRDLRTLLQYID
jgi:phosphoserine phosphatase